MRNKKLISMLMLSAGFVACTQDEIVENNFAGIENQKDLVEDVILNVGFGEDALTRGQYAGGYTAVGEDEKLTDWKIFQNFYLEPDWAEGELVLSNYAGLAGDQIGFCLTDGTNAITNYSFYIAGYHTAAQTEFKDEAAAASYTNNVYVFEDQSKSTFYGLGLTEKQEAVLLDKTTYDNAVSKLSKSLVGADLDADSLDVTKGIVRTNSGIMTGQYIGYYPYNQAWVKPSGIPLKGEKAMEDLFKIESLYDSQLDAVNGVGFYDYLMAVSHNKFTVDGGTRAGDVRLAPVTSAVTFILTNSDTKNASKTIKRITIRSIDEDAPAFVLEGTVEVGNLTGINATKTTDLIGISFAEESIKAATAADAEKKVDASQVYKYATIPFFANPSVKGYVVEIYNNEGQVAVIENKDLVFYVGQAPKTTIDLAEVKFEDAVRKIFEPTDFEVEMMAGGTLELMKDVTLTSAAKLMTVEKNLNIISNGHTLNLFYGTFNGNITMDGGELNLGGYANVNGKVSAKSVVIGNAVKGDVEASQLISIAAHASEISLADFTQLLKAPTVRVESSKPVTLTYVAADVLDINPNTNVTVKSTYVAATESTPAYTKTVKATTINNLRGTLTVNNLAGTTLNNIGGTVTVDGALNVTTVNNKMIDNGKYDRAKGVFNVTNWTGSTCTFNNVDWHTELNWDDKRTNTTDESMKLTVNVNAGTMNVNNAINLTGKIVNKATLNLNAEVALKGTIENNATLKINNNMSVQSGALSLNGGTATVAENADLNGNSPLVLMNGGKFEKIASSDFANEIQGASNFEKKYTAVRVKKDLSSTAYKVTANTKLILDNGAKLKLEDGSALKDIEVNGVTTLVAPKTTTATSITIYGTLNLLNSYMNVSGNVVNNGVYNGKTSTVNCAGFSGNGSWEDDVTPNC